MKHNDVLKQIGWPEEVLVLDFETYFDQEYSLKKLSTIEYVVDERFDFTGLGTAESPAFIPHFCPKKQDYLTVIYDFVACLQNRYGKDFERCTVVIQNAKFDALILKEKFGINPPYIIDTIDLARHYDARMSHKLKDLAELFKLKAKGDTQQFKGLHYEDMDTEVRKNLAAYCINDIEIESALFKILLPKISSPEIEIPLARHTLDLYLNPQIKLDFDKAEKLKSNMGQERDKILEEVNWVLEYKSKKKPTIAKIVNSDGLFIELLNKTLPDGETAPMKQGKRKLIPALAKDDEGMKQLLAHSKEEIRNLALARQAVGSWPLHIKRVNNLINQAKARNGYLGVPLHYYGGHTGRWSGAEKINVQNFGKRGRTGSGIHPLIKQVAGLIYAPDGYAFILSDYSQIEARILAWLAGQNDLLESFRRGEDVYSEFATELFNSSVYKPDETDPEPVQKLMIIRRGFGKDTILGCGFGMGTNKFYGNCLQNSDLRPLFDSGKYDWDFINKLIKTYRKTYFKIPEFWKFCEKAFRWVTKYPNEIVSYYFDDNNITVHGHLNRAKNLLRNSLLTFWNENGTVIIQLPSGRELRYRHSRIIRKAKGEKIAWHWGHLWGGSITENIVQAIARDILAKAILNLEKAGHSIVCHIHDSTVVLVEKEKAELALANIENMMRFSPAWAIGLPIDVESKIQETF